MKTQAFHCLAVGAALALFPAAAMADGGRDDCDVTIQELGESKVNGYNALAGGEYLEPIRIRLRNQGDDACTGSVTITRLIGGTRLDGPHSHALDYQIVDATIINRIVLDPVTNQSNAIPMTVPARGTIEIRPRLRVPGGQPGRSGRYDAVLEAKFRSADRKREDDTSFTVAAQVSPSAQANFVGFAQGGNARLNLGELAPNVTGSIGLQVRASSDVELRISSENDGHLTGQNGFRIPYRMTVAGQLLDLADPDQIDVDLQDSVRGHTLPVSVVVGTFNNAPVGRYGDVVTFRISAR